MTYYGKVIDENGDPLPNVKFEFLLEAYPEDWTFATRGRPYDKTTINAFSDANGLFEFVITGCMLSMVNAEKSGYRQLEELDDGSRASNKWNTVYTRKLRLISWGDAQYRSANDNPTVFVFVKQGVHQITALPCQGGYHRHGAAWKKNEPGWPMKPSLDDVDWKHGQPRENVAVPLVIKAVDTQGRPLANVNVHMEVERYRSLEEMRNYPGQRHNRTTTVRSHPKTDDAGLARITVEGIRLADIYRAELDGTEMTDGLFLLDEAGGNYYARDFVDDRGRLIYRCDEFNPIVIVMFRKDDHESRVMPSRGGYELRNEDWHPVAPSWPANARGRMRFAGSTQPAKP